MGLRNYANWLTGYNRYLAGLSEDEFVGADGDVTLVTSPEEVPLAIATSSAREVRSFGTGGFGLDLDSMSTLLGELREDQSPSRARGASDTPDSPTARPRRWTGSRRPAAWRATFSESL